MPGENQKHQTGAISGERRQVTALFYDIVGSTALLHELDPEEFGLMQRALHNEAAAAIAGNGGYLERIQGDGGCAYFGLPEASEDAAECAVLTALEMVQRCQRMAQSGSRLKIRVGIATGLVVIADTSNTGLPSKTEIIGITPALAARIQSEAAPDSVVVAEATYRLTSGVFEFEGMGTRELKGFGEPARLWRPVARRRPADRFTAHRRPSAVLVGRDEELDLCSRRWLRAKEGSGQLVYLHGDAGIGKSRLVTEVRRKLAGEGASTRLFQCHPRGNVGPLHPFLDPIRQTIAEAAGVPEADRAAVIGWLEALGPDVGGLNAEIVAFLLAGKAQGGEAWQIDLTDEEIRARAVDAMLAVLTASAAGGPVLVVIEDLHWADTLTGALVAGLARWIGPRPVLALVTSREATPSERLGDPNVLSLALPALSASATSELLDRIWEAPPPAGLAEFIHEKSDGVPLFAEQLALLVREGARSGAADRAAWEALLRERRVLNLQDLIAARLAGLGPLRRLAQVAGVIGREFRRRLLDALMEAEQLPVSLDEAVDSLVQAGILRREAAGTTIRFRHVLIQEAAYESLLKSERKEIHGRIVGLVRSGAVPPLPDETMAWHCEHAGLPLDAARHAVQAAEDCGVRSAMHEADRLLDFAEKQLALAGGSEEANDLLLRVLTAQGPVAAALYGRGGERARSIYERGVSLCAEGKNQDRAEWFPLYWGWWFTAPDFQAQRARSDILLRDLEGSSDPEVSLQSLHCAWATSTDAGLHAHCIRCVERGLRLYDADRARFSRVRYGGHDAKVCGLGNRAFSLWHLGDDAGASESIGAAIAWAEHINHPNSLLHALEFELELARYWSDHDGAIRVTERIAGLAADNPGVLAKAALFRAWARGVSGEAAAGLAEFEAALARQREIATPEGKPVFEGMRAELLERAGSLDRALSVLDGAIAASMESGQVFWLPELLRQRAVIRHARHEPQEAAETDLRRAVETGTDQGASALVSRVRKEMERLGIRTAGA